MAKPKQVKINANNFHNAIKALKELEKSGNDLTIDGIPLSEFLLNASDNSTTRNSLAAQVKIAILITHGINNPDPNSLDEATEMSEFNFSDMQYIALTRRFNPIARQTNPNANITVAAVKACDTVQDCIDLVAAAS